MGIESIHTLLNHNLDVSARDTQVALAVVNRKNANGQYEEVLAEVDLKTASLWTKIVLWWNNSLKKKTIRQFMNRHIQNWTNTPGVDRVQLEKQCTKISRKITSTNPFTWTLHVDVEYPSQSDPTKMITSKKIVQFDRLTSNATLYASILNGNSAEQTIHSKSLYVDLKQIFDSHLFTGDYKGETAGLFMNDQEKGADRTCKIQFSQLNQANLDRIYTDTITQEAYSRGYQSGRRESYRNDYYYRDTSFDVLDGLATGLLISSAFLPYRGHCRRRYF